MTITSHGAYVKLTVSSLDYTKEGMCRMILSKALTATDEVINLLKRIVYMRDHRSAINKEKLASLYVNL